MRNGSDKGGSKDVEVEARNANLGTIPSCYELKSSLSAALMLLLFLSLVDCLSPWI
jgi:hypothetical protein